MIAESCMKPGEMTEKILMQDAKLSLDGISNYYYDFEGKEETIFNYKLETV